MAERLVVSRSNPRYFEHASSAGSGPAVYLSGSHVNNNFHDGAGPGLDCADVPEVVEAAGARGIYVSVMLFDGFALHLTRTPDNVRGHPFHAGNTINGVGIGSIRDYQVLPLDPRVQALQEAYLRKVVDTVGDLPNVLYEVANESSGSDTADAVTLPMAPLSTRGSATPPSGSTG
jgi:hypothetical protein